MSIVVQYDPADTVVANRVVNYLLSANTPDFSSLPNTLINPDLSSVSGVDWKYWKYDSLSTPQVVEMTAPEKSALDESLRVYETILDDIILEAVDAGVTNVISNDRPSIEIADGITGFGSHQLYWPSGNHTKIKATVKFILKETGTGSNVRLAFKYKSQSTGSDSSGSFADEDFTVVAVTYTTIGEIFEGSIELDATGISQNDSVALHIGRDGNNSIGAGTNDDIDSPIQIISTKIEAN